MKAQLFGFMCLLVAACPVRAELAVVRNGRFTGTFYAEDLPEYRAFHERQGETCVWVEARPVIVSGSRQGRPVYRAPTPAELANVAPKPSSAPNGLVSGGRLVVTGECVEVIGPTAGYIFTDPATGHKWIQIVTTNGVGPILLPKAASPEKTGSEWAAIVGAAAAEADGKKTKAKEGKLSDKEKLDYLWSLHGL